MPLAPERSQCTCSWMSLVLDWVFVKPSGRVANWYSKRWILSCDKEMLFRVYAGPEGTKGVAGATGQKGEPGLSSPGAKGELGRAGLKGWCAPFVLWVSPVFWLPGLP